MSVLYYAFLDAVTVPTGGQTIIINDGSDRTATVAAGTYYLRGDGSSDDLLKAVTDAIDAATSRTLADSYVRLDVDADNAGAQIYLELSDTWTLKTTGTFDLSLLGIDQALHPGNVTIGILSTLTPACVWTPNEPPRNDDDDPNGVVFLHRAADGSAYHFDAGGPYSDRAIGFSLLDRRRVRAFDNPFDEAATFRAFWERVRGGTTFEVHSLPISSGTVLVGPSQGSRVGRFKLAESSARRVPPVRYDPGVALYSFDLELIEVSMAAPALPSISYADQTQTVGDSESLSPTTQGTILAGSYAATGLPGGLSISASNGAITGTYTTVETVTATVTATGFVNGVPVSVSDTAAFTVNAASAATPPGTPSLWYDGSDIDGDGTNNSAYTDGDPITTWVDKGSLGVDATQTDAAKKPTFKTGIGPNGSDTILWDGTEVLTTATMVAQAQPITSAFMINVDDLPTTAAMHGQDGGNLFRLYSGTNEPIFLRSTTFYNTGVSMTFGTDQSVIARFDGSSSWARVDGVQSSNGNAGTTGISAEFLNIGALSSTAASGWIGEIAEVLIYYGAEDPTGIESYHASKYGVP